MKLIKCTICITLIKINPEKNKSHWLITCVFLKNPKCKNENPKMWKKHMSIIRNDVLIFRYRKQNGSELNLYLSQCLLCAKYWNHKDE